MKPTYEELEQQLAESHRALRAETTAHDHVKMHLEKMAAENAALKKFCKDAAFDADYEAELGMERGGLSDALNDIETPATDAFMAEVRAQGVEIYADNLDSSADDAERDGFDDAVKFLRSEASGVRLFAAQLRKGVQS